MNPDRGELLDFIKDHYSLEELKTLCFELYIPFDDLPGDSRAAKARELVSYAERHDRLETLLRVLATDHPQDYRERFGRKPRSPSRPMVLKPKPGQVFISHAHQDSELAHRLAGWLRELGHPVWLAPDSIRPGEQWVEAISRGLETSELFLLLMTPHAVDSRWVSFETNVAISQERQGRMTVIPLDVAESDAPALWQAYQAISFRDSESDGLDQLKQRLSGATEERGNGRLPASPKPVKPPADAPLSDWQADQIQVLAWSVGLELGREAGRNLYQPVYTLLNSHFGVASFRDIPAGRYQEARKFLSDWLQALVQTNTEPPQA